MEPHWSNIAAFWTSAMATVIALFAAFVGYVVYRSQSDPEVIVYASYRSILLDSMSF